MGPWESRWISTLLCVCLCLTTSWTESRQCCWADDRPPAASQPPTPSNSPPQGEATEKTPDKFSKRDRAKIHAATLLILGIVLLGVFLVAITLLGGAWLRRTSRQHLTPVRRPDELWYLKHPDQIDGSPPPTDPAADETQTG